MYNLTIIIPYYNSISKLNRLLDSIPPHEDIQTIIINDKSNINLDLYQKTKLRHNDKVFLENKTAKKGAGVCRNIGIEKAEGRWILFADSDDFFIKKFYEKASLYFNTNNEVVYFPPTSLDIMSGQPSNRHKSYQDLVLNYLENPSIYNENLLRYKYYVPWSKLISRDFIKAHDLKFDEVMVSNDVMFSTKVGFNLRSFAVDDNIIYCVTKDNEKSLTRNTSKEFFYIRIKKWLEYYKYLEKRLSTKEFKSLKISNKIFYYRAFKYRYGVKEMLNIYKIFKKELK